MKNISTKI